MPYGILFPERPHRISGNLTEKGMDRMKAGVSTGCLFPMDLEQAVKKLAGQGIELMEWCINTPGELRPESIKQLKKLKEECGIQVQSIHPFASDFEDFLFFTQYKGRLQDGIELYRHYFDAAAQLGASYVVFHGQHRNGSMCEEQAFEHIQALWETAEQYGVHLLQENVARCRGGDPEYLVHLHRALPQIEFVLDLKQALRAGHVPMDFVRQIGGSIAHVHVSDSSPEADCLPVGRGDFDFETLFAALRQCRNSFSAVVELYSDKVDSLPVLAESCKNLQTALSNIEK